MRAGSSSGSWTTDLRRTRRAVCVRRSRPPRRGNARGSLRLRVRPKKSVAIVANSESKIVSRLSVPGPSARELPRRPSRLSLASGPRPGCTRSTFQRSRRRVRRAFRHRRHRRFRRRRRRLRSILERSLRFLARPRRTARSASDASAVSARPSSFASSGRSTPSSSGSRSSGCVTRRSPGRCRPPTRPRWLTRRRSVSAGRRARPRRR